MASVSPGRIVVTRELSCETTRHRTHRPWRRSPTDCGGTRNASGATNGASTTTTSCWRPRRRRSAPKLARGAVSGTVIRTGAVGTDQLAPGAVTDATVAPDALTGAAIAESTLARVPAATRAARARAAHFAVHAATATRAAVSGSADRLAGVPAVGYLSRPTIVHATTPSDTARDKGPLSARCPTGMHVLSGGVAVYGATDGVTILRNVPTGAHGWAGLAHAGTSASRNWRLVVRAVCVQGGA